MTAWVIWESGPEDSELLARLEGDAFGARSWGARSVMDAYGAPGVTVLMGGKEGETAQGFAVIRLAAQEAEILTIGVAGATQNKGLGKALLTGLMKKAAEMGADTVFLEVAITNKRAIALYEAAGFIQSGHRKRYYKNGDDALVMAKTLLFSP